MAGTYHEYFIQNGQHIGRYEDMYQNCPDPWRIEELGPRLDMRAALLLLSGYEGSVQRFLDVGAGLGLFSGLLAEAIWRKNPHARGVITDISATAARGAEARLADARLEFRALDIRDAGVALEFPPASFNLVVMAQVLWGVLENLPGTLRSLAGLLPKGGLFLLSQHFPANQSYGADIVSCPDDLANYLHRAGFGIVNTLETNRAANHHWAALAVKEL